MEYRVEILMATYNGEKYLSEQIESIISQSYENWTLLIRDDNSKDSTVSIIEKYEKKDNRIRLLRDRKGNLGFIKNFEELLIESQELNNFIYLDIIKKIILKFYKKKKNYCKFLC